MFLKWLHIHTPNLITGFALGFTGYFSPLKGIVHVMIAAILFDLLLGVFVAWKTGRGIKSKKLWRTGYKLIIAVALVMLTFSMDTEIKGFFEVHKILAWIITGFEVWSIVESAAKLTDHKAFRIIKKVMEDKVKDKTGIDLNKTI